MYYEYSPKTRAWSTLESLCASAFTVEFGVTISYTSQEDFTFYVCDSVHVCTQVWVGVLGGRKRSSDSSKLKLPAVGNGPACVLITRPQSFSGRAASALICRVNSSTVSQTIQPPNSGVKVGEQYAEVKWAAVCVGRSLWARPGVIHDKGNMRSDPNSFRLVVCNRLHKHFTIWWG